MYRENRYLLFLTENHAALQTLQHFLEKGTEEPFILFGSSFPKDQEYTQVGVLSSFGEVPHGVICATIKDFKFYNTLNDLTKVLLIGYRYVFFKIFDLIDST